MTMENTHDKKVYEKTVRLPRCTYEEYNRLLQMTSLEKDEALDSTLTTVTAYFDDGKEMDIKFCSGTENYFIDVVLFKNGYECGCILGDDRLDDTFEIEDEGAVYRTIIVFQEDILAFERFVRDCRDVQIDFKGLFDNGKVTKKSIRKICIPFRNRYHLDDRTVLQIARNELTLGDIDVVYHEYVEKYSIRNDLQVIIENIDKADEDIRQTVSLEEAANDIYQSALEDEYYEVMKMNDEISASLEDYASEKSRSIISDVRDGMEIEYRGYSYRLAESQEDSALHEI